MDGYLRVDAVVAVGTPASPRHYCWGDMVLRFWQYAPAGSLLAALFSNLGARSHDPPWASRKKAKSVPNGSYTLEPQPSPIIGCPQPVCPYFIAGPGNCMRSNYFTFLSTTVRIFVFKHRTKRNQAQAFYIVLLPLFFFFFLALYLFGERFFSLRHCYS